MIGLRVMRIIRAEWWPPNDRLVHDGPQGPPVTAEAVTLPTEDFRGNVVWGAHSRVGHCPPGLTPVVDLASVADRQVDLVKVDRVSILAPLVGGSTKQLLVV